MERLALVISSEWHASGRLVPVLGKHAEAVARVLTDPVTGGWTPALPGRPLLLDPTAAELDEALRLAFERAHRERAVLLVFFVGHGVLTEDDYYLMATDSTDLPDSRDSLLLGQRFKELLRRYSGLDGLVLVVDACHSGRAIRAAGRHFLDQISRARRRVEVLTASDDDPAFGACLARAVVTQAAIGHADYGERLRVADVRELARDTCRLQVPQQFSFDGTSQLSDGDPALWLLHNPGSRWLRSPLAGTALLGEVERLLTNRVHRPVFAEAGRALAGQARCVVLHGPRGSGKSVVVAGLLERGTPVHAAILLRGGELLSQVAAELRRQLTAQVEGFAEAFAAYCGRGDLVSPGADPFELNLLGPLRLLPAPAEVRIVVDGVDALSGQRDRLWAGLIALATDPAVPVRLLVATRAVPDGLAGAEVVAVPRATVAELTEFARLRELEEHQVQQVVEQADGNWAAAHLFAEGFVQRRGSADGGQVPRGLAEAYTERLRRARLHDESDPLRPHTRSVLAALTAAGAGPVLPFPLLAKACGLTETQTHAVLPRLGSLIVRGQPGTAAERAGLAEPELAEHLAGGTVLGVDPAEWHARLADAITELAPPGSSGPIADYAAAAEARHRWRAGRFAAALDSLDEREAQIPVEQRERWIALARLTDEQFGADHPLTLRAQARTGTWTAKAGDPATALDTFAQLLDQASPLLGEDHPEVLNLRENQAFWLGETGNWPLARDLFDALVADCARLLGPEHPQTLMARQHVALSATKCRQEQRGLALFHELLPLRERVLGPAHLDTLRTRHNIAFWESYLAYPPPVRFSFAVLVDDLASSVGSDHPETLTARYHQAVFLPETERAQAIALLRELRPAIERVLGPWHGDLRRLDAKLAEYEEPAGR
ncbi:caspase family protein [Crossiella sp. NPDC003009]